MSRWYVSLDPAVIQDGGHVEVHRGQQAEFAVAFGPGTWEPSPPAGDVAAVRVEGSRYDVVARVVAVADEAWVLDCGLVVGCEGQPPAGVGVDHWVAGRAQLALIAHGRPPTGGVPHLSRTWFIERVSRKAPPAEGGWVDLGLPGGPEEPGWEELAFTDAWHDDDGRAEYLLECLLVT